MKATRDNLFTDGARGSTRNMTISKRQSGQFIISGRRGKNTKLATPGQQEVKDRFKQASMYAKAAVDNLETKAVYAAAVRPDFNAYTIAMTDALQPPKVHSVDLLEFTGEVGKPIMVKATDDFKVSAVRVWIRNAAGELVETGNAVQQPDNPANWAYTTTVAVPQVVGAKVTAIAFDLPGNQGLREEIVK